MVSKFWWEMPRGNLCLWGSGKSGFVFASLPTWGYCLFAWLKHLPNGQPAHNIVGKAARRRCAAAWGAELALHPKLQVTEPCQYLCCIPRGEEGLRSSKLYIFGAGSWLRQEQECCHDVYRINMCYCCSHLSVQFWRSCRWPFKYLQGLQLFQSGFIFSPLSPSCLAPYSN